MIDGMITFILSPCKSLDSSSFSKVGNANAELKKIVYTSFSKDLVRLELESLPRS